MMIRKKSLEGFEYLRILVHGLDSISIDSCETHTALARFPVSQTLAALPS